MSVMPTLWVIRAGRNDEARSLFLTHSCIALDRSVTGNLRSMQPDVAEIGSRLRQHDRYAELSDQSIREKAGQLYKFLYDMRRGDRVLYPEKNGGAVHFGEITGEYQFTQAVLGEFAHRRNVRWLMAVSRTELSADALKQVNRQPSLYTVSTCLDEFAAFYKVASNRR